MGHIRFGGVCLLLLVIAAALPICVLAQSQQADAGSDSGSDATAQNAAASISRPSESSKADTISAEGLSRRNVGLKPLGSSSRFDIAGRICAEFCRHFSREHSGRLRHGKHNREHGCREHRSQRHR